VSFRELRQSDGSRVRHKRVAESDGKEVAYDEMVKGYELSPEQYVVITKDELESLNPKKTRAIEIEDFVALDEIDPIYFDHPYYLGPDKGAERAYALLVKAMDDERKVAIGRFVLRNRESLAALRPMDGVLTLTTMRFADEVVAPDELGDVIPDDVEKPKKKELDMAKQLVGQLESKFEPDKYRDEYREELLAMIERKAEGADVIESTSEAPTPTKAPDLMAALEESLAAVKREPLGAGKSASKSTAKKTTASRKPKAASKSKSTSRSKAKAK
jgi:DNA end-binding protein Ku